MTNNQKIFFVLRVGAAMCFIGHGAFGIITKAVWCNYFAVFGIGPEMAYRLMPFLGTIDILMGISLLVYPTRAILVWLVIWGLVTAALRPLSGEPFAELIERSGNYGVPAALIFLCGGVPQAKRGVLRRISAPPVIDQAPQAWVFSCLRLTVFLLLLGHGWLNLIEKRGLLGQYKSIGFYQPETIAHCVGSFEVLTAFAVLLFPNRSLVLAIFVWKMSSELLYPHYEFFEWIERGGSYAAILGLWYCLGLRTRTQQEESLTDQLSGHPKRTWSSALAEHDPGS